MPKANTDPYYFSGLVDRIARDWSEHGAGKSKHIRLNDCFDVLAQLLWPPLSVLAVDAFIEAHPWLLQVNGENLAVLLEKSSERFVSEQCDLLSKQGFDKFSHDGLRAFFFSSLYESLRFHPLLNETALPAKKRARHKRQGSAYFSPSSLAYLAAHRAFEHYLQNGGRTDHWPQIFDPAMGTGLYLVAALDYLSWLNPHIDRTDIFKASLFGVDFDAITCGVAANCLSLAAGKRIDHLDENLIWADAIAFDSKKFDIILSNPPWDIVKTTDTAGSIRTPARVNKSRIARLRQRFQHQGEGDTSYYKLFLELSHQLLNENGVASILLPMALCGDLGAAPLRRLLWDRCRWHTLDGFINEDNAFAIHPHFKYILVSFQKGGSTAEVKQRFGLRAGLDPLLDAAFYDGKKINFSRELSATVGGAHGVVVELGCQKDIDILTGLAGRHKRLIDFILASRASFKKEFDITLDKGKFVSVGKAKNSIPVLPLLEGVSISQFGLKEGSSESRFFISSDDWSGRRLHKSVRLGFVSTSSPFNTRSMIASCLPDWPAANSLTVVRFLPQVKEDDAVFHTATEEALFTSAIFNSFVFDWMIRLRLSGNNLSYHIVQDMFFPTPQKEQTDLFKMCVALAAIITYGGSEGAVLIDHWPSEEINKCLSDSFYRRVFEQLDQHKTAGTHSLRARIWLEVLICSLYGLDTGQVSHILRDCQFDKDFLVGRRRILRRRDQESVISSPDQRSFFRVDKNLDAHLRLTNLVRQTFISLIGIDENNGSYKKLSHQLQNDGCCSALPESVEAALIERFEHLRQLAFAFN